jgi:hypothetical protein
MITGALRRFMKDKIVSSVNKLPIDKKRKFTTSYSSVVKIYKLFLFLMPISLVAVPYALYTYQPESFFHIFVLEVLVYVLIVDDLLYRRSVLIKIRET